MAEQVIKKRQEQGGGDQSDLAALFELVLSASPRRLDPSHILDALVSLLPDLGKSIAKAHYGRLLAEYPANKYDDAKNSASELIMTPDAVSAHSPAWHQFGIVKHTQLVVDVAKHNKWREIDNKNSDLNWAVDELRSRKLDDISLYDLLTISLALHDIGKFQPSVSYCPETNTSRIEHKGHEERGGAIIAAARSSNVPDELTALADVFNSFAVTRNHLDYIEQCVRVHGELCKLRQTAQEAGLIGYEQFAQSDRFKSACQEIAKAHAGKPPYADMSLEKGVLFLFDSCGKLEFWKQREFFHDFASDPQGALGRVEKYVKLCGADPRLVGAFEHYPLNLDVGLAYLQSLRQSELHS